MPWKFRPGIGCKGIQHFAIVDSKAFCLHALLVRRMINDKVSSRQECVDHLQRTLASASTAQPSCDACLFKEGMDDLNISIQTMYSTDLSAACLNRRIQKNNSVACRAQWPQTMVLIDDRNSLILSRYQVVKGSCSVYKWLCEVWERNKASCTIPLGYCHLHCSKFRSQDSQYRTSLTAVELIWKWLYSVAGSAMYKV